MEQNGRPIRIWAMLGVVDWWWLLVAGSLEFWAAEALHVPGWVPSLSGLWIFVQAAWLKRAEPSSKAIYLYAVSTATTLALAAPAVTRLAIPLHVGLQTGGAAAWIVAIYVFRHEMRRHFTAVDPRGLELSGVMTFFFSTLYFQYWYREIYKEQTEPALTISPSQG